MKKILALVVALMMIMSVAAMAQTVAYDGDDKGTATITITNAANGETYKVAKLFDATVTGTTDGSIAYTGTIPDTMSNYFEYVNGTDGTNGITAKDGLDLTDEAVQEVLRTWAEAHVTAQAVSDGTALEFTNLPYGYYIITTTQGETLLTVHSTNPNATVIDKNTTPPINNLKKYAGEEEAADAEDTDNNVNIGDTVTYTISFDTANYSTENGGSKQIIKYIISDNFAEGVLTDVTVTSIKVGDTELTVQQFDENGKIEIAWATEVADSDPKAYTSNYPNGAKLTITYTATVADTAAIDGEGNTNKATVDYEDVDGNGSPDKHEVEETIYTFAIAVKKVDQAGADLANAVFQFPFYVKADADTDGAYVYAGTTAAEGLVNELTTPASGLIIVKGVKDGTYSITETAAPDGYNKLTEAVEVEAVQTGSTTTSTTTYLDENGEIVDTQTEAKSTVNVTIDELAATPVVVVNKTGATLPSTGGIGTTIFYIAGSILVLAAAVLLVTKRRMGNND